MAHYECGSLWIPVALLPPPEPGILTVENVLLIHLRKSAP